MIFMVVAMLCFMRLAGASSASPSISSSRLGAFDGGDQELSLSTLLVVETKRWERPPDG
jgi:hypothetical protein